MTEPNPSDNRTIKEIAEHLSKEALWINGLPPINCIGLALVIIGIIVILYAYFSNRRS